MNPDTRYPAAATIANARVTLRLMVILSHDVAQAQRRRAATGVLDAVSVA